VLSQRRWCGCSTGRASRAVRCCPTACSAPPAARPCRRSAHSRELPEETPAGPEAGAGPGTQPTSAHGHAASRRSRPCSPPGTDTGPGRSARRSVVRSPENPDGGQPLAVASAGPLSACRSCPKSSRRWPASLGVDRSRPRGAGRASVDGRTRLPSLRTRRALRPWRSPPGRAGRVRLVVTKTSNPAVANSVAQLVRPVLHRGTARPRPPAGSRPAIVTGSSTTFASWIPTESRPARRRRACSSGRLLHRRLRASTSDHVKPTGACRRRPWHAIRCVGQRRLVGSRGDGAADQLVDRWSARSLNAMPRQTMALARPDAPA
jgi:hypothetical protein